MEGFLFTYMTKDQMSNKLATRLGWRLAEDSTHKECEVFGSPATVLIDKAGRKCTTFPEHLSLVEKHFEYPPDFFESRDSLIPILVELSEEEWNDLLFELQVEFVQQERFKKVSQFCLTLPAEKLATALAKILK